MPDLEPRYQKPRVDALREIRTLLLTPNPQPRYARTAEDEAFRRRPRKRLLRTRLRPQE